LAGFAFIDELSGVVDLRPRQFCFSAKLHASALSGLHSGTGAFILGLQENGGKLCPEHEQIDAALTTARVFTIESKHLQLLTLCEQRINRSLQKTPLSCNPSRPPAKPGAKSK
jgi:hypothetical protein